MEFLKEVLGEELYNQVKEKVDAHNRDEANKDKLIKLANLSTGEYVGKGKYDTLETDLNSKMAELTSANALIEQLKGATKGNEALQSKISTYETEITELKEQNLKEQLKHKIEIALLKEKAMDIDYLTYRMKEDNQEITLDEKGEISGIEDIMASLKTKYPTQFESGTVKKIQENKLEDPESNNGTMTKNELLKKSYTERAAFQEANPEVYREIMSKE